MPLATTRPSPRRIHRLGTAAASAALAAVLLLAPAGAASAHDELIGSDPAADDVLATTPEQITLTFSDAPSTEAGATEVAVLDEDCASVASGDPVVDGNEVTQAIDGTIEGAVLVQWRVVSSDGHPISDEYVFSVGDDAAVTAAEQCGESAGEQNDGSSQGFNAVPYAVGAAVIFVAVGAVIAIAIVRGRRGETRE